MNLNEALDQLDIVEANLERLDRVWKKMRGLIPEGISFDTGSPTQEEYEELRRAFGELLRGLPPIGGWRIDVVPDSLNDIAQNRLDASEVGFIDAVVSTEESIFAADEAIATYRFRLRHARSKLVRDRTVELVKEVERLVVDLDGRIPVDGNPIEDAAWEDLQAAISEIERLVGPAALRIERWNDLLRHIRFGQRVDLHDIANFDWPVVRPRIESVLYSEHEPMPTAVEDVAELLLSRPDGKATTALAWDRLDAEGFERLVFNLIDGTDGYENAQWLTRTNAPDRGRDLSVDRVQSDPLSGSSRLRVIIQCKHHPASSVTMPDASDMVSAMSLWEPPPVDVLVIATSGRFTTDAVDWIERHNQGSRRPRIEMWADSHLESLLAQRPGLVAELGLRP